MSGLGGGLGGGRWCGWSYTVSTFGGGSGGGFGFGVIVGGGSCCPVPVGGTGWKYSVMWCDGGGFDFLFVFLVIF